MEMNGCRAKEEGGLGTAEAHDPVQLRRQRDICNTWDEMTGEGRPSIRRSAQRDISARQMHDDLAAEFGDDPL